MKILVIQLARLGDIYQTWPALHALKRQNAGAVVHLVTRSTFAGAVPVAPGGAGLVDRHVPLDSRETLSPLIDEKPAIDSSLEKLDAFCERLRAENYTHIVNLTFSAFSSYLTSQIETPRTVVSGYTRFSDGYLRIPDDGSAYFYAQAGVGRPNRLHVTDLFAHVAGVELTDADWAFGPARSRGVDDSEGAVLVHVGASALGKTLSWSKWLQVVKGLLNAWKGPVVLIGSGDEERRVAEKIAVTGAANQVVNLVGQTALAEIFQMVAEARLLIGGDSAPMQIASLTGTPALNISLPTVSFWETGPRAKGSRIVVVASEDAVASDEIVAEALSMLKGQPPRLPVVRVPGPTLPYVESRPQPMAFEWELLRALYMAEGFPAPPSELFLLGMKRMQDVNALALEQIQTLRDNPANKTASAILDRADEIMDQIVQEGMVPEAAPLLRWFRTERLRIGPMPVEQLISSTEAVHRRFADVIGLYLNEGGGTSAEGDQDDRIVVG